MIARNDAALPSLPSGVQVCRGDRNVAHVRSQIAACPKCVGAVVERVAPKVAVPKRRPGVEREAAMKAALDGAGYVDTTFDDFVGLGSDEADKCYRRQVPWGIELDPPRGFAADFGFVRARLLVEVVGLAHGNYSMLKRDLDRESLARSVGWTVLRLDPEWIKDGRAIQEVSKALTREA